MNERAVEFQGMRNMMIQSKKIVGIISLILVIFLAGCAGITALVKEKPLISLEEIPAEVHGLYKRAEDAFETKKYDEALNLYQEIIGRVTTGAVVMWSHVRVGQIFAAKGDHGKAVQELTAVMRRFENDPLYNEARYYLARSYALSGQFGLSTTIAEQLIHEKISSRREGEVHALIGDNFLAEGKAYEALLSYMKALKKKPETELAEHLRNNSEGIIMQRLSPGELETARETFSSGYPGGYILYALVQSYYDVRDITRAKKFLKQYLHQYKDHPYAEEALILNERFAEMEVVDRYAIGCLLPLSGRFARYGYMALDAIMLASDMFDPAKGSPIRLIVEDTKSDPETARQAVVKMFSQDKVIGIIGPLGSKVASEAAREAQRLGIPMITMTQTSEITEIGDYVFRNFLTATMQIETLVRYSVQNLGMKTFAILYPDDDYGTDMMNLFWDEVLRWGGDIRGVETYDKNKTDFGTEIKSLVGLDSQEKPETGEEPKPIIDFDALFIPDSYSRVSLIAPQLAFYDVTGIQLLGTNAWNSPELAKRENEFLDGAIFVDGFFRDSFYPVVREFIDRFYVAYNREPTDIEALVFDAASILVSLLQGYNIEVRDDLKNGLLRLTAYPGVTGETSFLESGDVQKSLNVLMVRGNTIIQIK